jgi:hypothetical protein
VRRFVLWWRWRCLLVRAHLEDLACNDDWAEIFLCRSYVAKHLLDDYDMNTRLNLYD